MKRDSSVVNAATEPARSVNGSSTPARFIPSAAVVRSPVPDGSGSKRIAASAFATLVAARQIASRASLGVGAARQIADGVGERLDVVGVLAQLDSRPPCGR